MNINKIVKDSVSSIKHRYDNTQLNPFKMPENINITIKHDIVGSYKDFFKALDNMTPEDMEKIGKTLTRVAEMMDNKFNDWQKKGKK